MKFKEGDLVKSIVKQGCYTAKSEGIVSSDKGSLVEVRLTKAKNKKDVGRTISFSREELVLRDITPVYTALDTGDFEIKGLRQMIEEESQLDNKLAARYNTGKPKLSFVHPIIMEEIARVMEYGAKKYARDNWRKGLPINSIIDSALRHLMDFKEGSTYDKESNETELGHAACNIMFAMYVLKYKPELDDRVKNERAD